MKLWIIAAIVVGVLVIASFGVTSFVKADSEPAKTTQPSNGPTCGANGGCGNKCTAESNCGLATCGAKNGGTCGCGK